MSRTSKQSALKRLVAAARQLDVETMESYIDFIEDRVRTRKEGREHWASLTPEQQAAVRAYFAMPVAGGAR